MGPLLLITQYFIFCGEEDGWESGAADGNN